MAREGEQDGVRLPPPSSSTAAQVFLFPHQVFFRYSQDQRERDQFHGKHVEPLGLFLESGSNDTVFSAADSEIVRQSLDLQQCREGVCGSVGRMCLEMKGSPDQELRRMDMDGCKSSSSCGGGGGGGAAVTKMCSSCSTTKTPLWRSGPKGPKSLCNACGIRQRKARRAMEAAAAAAGSGLVAARKVGRERKIEGNCILPYKKRYRIISATAAAAASSESSSALCQVLPQDEKDAAVLLMALSCGLIHG